MKRLLATLLLLCGVFTVQGKELSYFGSDPYAALAEAKRTNRLLLVEFYAPWSRASRWAHERILPDSSVRRMLDERFLLVVVDTQTPEGASLAATYQVTDYPSIVFFDSNGTVLAKIGKGIDRDGFRYQLETLLLASGSRSGWRMDQAFAAAESGDVETADHYARLFLTSEPPPKLINSATWPLFENSLITRYGSPSFNYLVDHRAAFEAAMGADRVDRLLGQKIENALIKQVVGTEACDTAEIDRMAALGKTLVAGRRIELLGAAAKARANDQLSDLIRWIGLSLNEMDDELAFPLMMAFEVVAERGNESQRKAAAALVRQVRQATPAFDSKAVLGQLEERIAK